MDAVMMMIPEIVHTLNMYWLLSELQFITILVSVYINGLVHSFNPKSSVKDARIDSSDTHLLINTEYAVICL